MQQWGELGGRVMQHTGDPSRFVIFTNNSDEKNKNLFKLIDIYFKNKL